MTPVSFRYIVEDSGSSILRQAAPVTPTRTSPASSRSEPIVIDINSITLSGRTPSYPNDPSVAEEFALNWLIEDDVGTSPSNKLKLRQRFTLATLYFQNGPFAVMRGTWLEPPRLHVHSGTWLTSIEECDWESIEICVSGEVTSVGLQHDAPRGQLPSNLGLLTALSSLDVGVNELSGSIPSEIGLLTALTGLNLMVNRLSGSVPSEIGLFTDLKWLSLYKNQLTGTIPTELIHLTALESLDVHVNNVSGRMPFYGNATRAIRLGQLEADCNEITCDCCTGCCPGGSRVGRCEAGV